MDMDMEKITYRYGDGPEKAKTRQSRKGAAGYIGK